MSTSLCFKAARRHGRSSVSQAARAAIESLETRRLMSYAPTTLDEPGTVGMGTFMTTAGNYVLANDNQPSGADGIARLFRADGTLMRTFEGPATEGSGGGLAFIGEPSALVDDDNDGTYEGTGHVAVSTVEPFTGIGHVYIYDLADEDAAAVEVTNTYVNAPGNVNLFGWVLHSWNNFLLVGAQNRGTPTSAASLGVYRLDGTYAGLEIADAQNDGAMESDQFGFTGAVSGNTFVTRVGDIGDSEVQQFTLGLDLSGNPTATYAHTYSDPTANGSFTFGLGLALDGNDLFASGYSDLTFQHQVVYRFDAGTGADVVTETYASGNADDMFGTGIAASNGKLAIGAPAASTDAGATHTGAVYVYDYDADTNTPVDTAPDVIANPNPTEAASFGARVGKMSDGRFAVSDSSHNGGAGAMYVFTPVADDEASAEIDGDGNLVVTGTGDGETIEIRSAGAAGVGVYVDGVLLGNFAVSGKVIVHGGDGADVITVNGDVLLNADLFGDAGNDTIVGGGGNDFLSGGADNDHLTSRTASDILLGGAGNDVLLGGNGRDLLIGGTGADAISGDNAEDILIAGSTTHDGNRASLDSIQAIWNGGSSRDARVAMLEGGLLAASNLIADSDIDSLLGGNGTDYFLADDWDGEVIDDTRKEQP